MASNLRQLGWFVASTATLTLLGCGGKPTATEAEQEAMLQTVVLVNRAHNLFENAIAASSETLFTTVKYETPPFVARARRCLQSPTPKNFRQTFDRYVDALDELLEYVDQHDYNDESEAVLTGYAQLADKVGVERKAIKSLLGEYVPELQD